MSFNRFLYNRVILFTTFGPLGDQDRAVENLNRLFQRSSRLSQRPSYTCELLRFPVEEADICRVETTNEKLSNFYNKLCDEIDISCPILKFTIPLLEFNILSEINGRLLSITSELKFNNVKLNFAESQKCDRINILCLNNLNLIRKTDMGCYTSYNNQFNFQP